MKHLLKVFHCISLLFRGKHNGNIPVGILLLAGFVYIYFNPFFPHGPNKNPNESSRIYLTNAIVTRGEMNINYEIRKYGNIIDKAKVNNNYYCDKAPGLSLISVPPVFAYHRLSKLIGFEYSIYTALYFAKLFSLVIPSLIILFLLYLFISEIVTDERARIAIIISYALGTLAYPFTVLFFSHQLTACLIFSIFYILYKSRSKPPTKKSLYFLLAGFLAGVCVLVEYPAVIVAAILFIWLIFIEKSPKTLLFPIAAAPMLLVFMLINNSLFGSPFSTGYSHLSSGFAEVHKTGFMGITYPHPEAIKGLLFHSSRGLFPLCPHLAIGAVGLFIAKKFDRNLTILLPAIFISVVLFFASFGHWEGGWTLGPRHLTVLMPFLTIGLALAFKFIEGREKAGERTLFTVFLASSTLIISLSTLAFPYFPPVYDYPVAQMTAPLLFRGYFPENILSWIGVSGFASIIPWVAALLAALFLVLKMAYSESTKSKWLIVAVAAILTLAIVGGKLYLGGERNDAQERRLQMIIKDYK